jgi:hypothetical protein
MPRDFWVIFAGTLLALAVKPIVFRVLARPAA